jgi:hypothetical protein
MSQSSKTNAIPKGTSDPYLAWAQVGDTTDFESCQFDADAKLLVMYELELSKDLLVQLNNSADLDAAQIIATRPITIEFLAIGQTIKLHPIWWRDSIVYGTAALDSKGLVLFQTMAANSVITRFEVSYVPRMARASQPLVLPEINSKVTKPAMCDEEILYGLIDHGCPFAHSRLKTQEQRSRLLNVWYQDQKQNKLTETSPTLWQFGYTVTSQEINAFLSLRTGMEDWQIYAQAQMPELLVDSSHGAHMLGDLLDATNSPSLLWDGIKDKVPQAQSVKPPKNPDVVFVQLPDIYLSSTTRNTLVAYRLSALRYLLSCAGTNTKKIIAPISSEIFVGSHDGTTLFEMALDAMIEFSSAHLQKELHVLISASNALRLRTHTHSGAVAVQQCKFPLRVYPANELPTFAEVWIQQKDGEDGAVGVLDVTIQSRSNPNDPPLLEAKGLALHQGQAAQDNDGKVIAGVLSMDLQRQQVLLVRLPPSFSYDDRVATLPSGDWEISISSTSTKFEAHAYIARSTHGMGGQLRSYQSQWIEPRRPIQLADTLQAPDDLLDEFPDYGAGSINGMANGQKVIVIGGYRLWDKRRSSYSGAAPARPKGRLAHSNYAVDYAAPSDESPSLSGIRSWSNRSGGSARLNGASVATPLAARSVANGNTTPNPPTPSPSPSPTSKKDPQIPPEKFLSSQLK